METINFNFIFKGMRRSKIFMDEWQKSFSIRKTYKNWCFLWWLLYRTGSRRKKKFDRFLRYFFYMCEGETLLLRKEKKVPCRFRCELFFLLKLKISFIASAKKVSWNINQHKFTSHSIMFYIFYIHSFIGYWNQYKQ